MTNATAIHGHDIINLVATYPDGIRLSQLMEMVDERFGNSVTFHTMLGDGHGPRRPAALSGARDKARITSGVVYSGGSQACDR
jgi:hypothetical protein